MIEIQELQNYTQSQYEDLRTLMSELTDRVILSQMDLMNVLKNDYCHLYVMMDDGHIIGCATLCIFHSPTGAKASVEDVVVSSAFRGQHLGRRLMEYVLEQARLLVPMDLTGSSSIELHLTSNPKRIAANHLYQSLGFKRKDTNCYRMMIS